MRICINLSDDIDLHNEDNNKANNKEDKVMGGAIFLIVIIVIVAWVLASCIRIVPQAYAVILERLGAYQATWSTGIHFKVPFIERVANEDMEGAFEILF